MNHEQNPSRRRIRTQSYDNSVSEAGFLMSIIVFWNVIVQKYPENKMELRPQQIWMRLDESFLYVVLDPS